MENKFSIISKEATNYGFNTLVSFASKPLWKDFEALYRQEEELSYYDEDIAKYALKTYGNPTNYEIITLSEAKNKFKEFVIKHKKEYGW